MDKLAALTIAANNSCMKRYDEFNIPHHYEYYLNFSGSARRVENIKRGLWF